MSKDNEIVEAEFSVVEVDNPENLPSTEVLEDGEVSQVDLEFEFARSNIIKILSKSDDVLEATTDLVIEAEHPRMVEVYAGLVKTLADVNKSLLELREKKMKIKGEDVEVATTKASPTNVTNNTIFVGSTEELMKAMKG